MELPLYQVDAFTSEVFKGNPAAVVPLDSWLPDDILQKIAIENNLSETAFFIPDGDDFYLRWFTPTYEIDLCGHATLASSYVILNELYPDRDKVIFKTNVAGDLIVKKKNNQYQMDFPSRAGKKINIKDIPEIVLSSLNGPTPVDAYKSRDLMLVYESEEAIRNLKPNFHELIAYPHAICVTAQADENINFISRFFCAYDVTIPEDPVTGSAHCTLTPYWAEKLGKTKLKAKQISARGGDLELELKNNRVYITGNATLYLRGKIYV